MKRRNFVSASAALLAGSALARAQMQSAGGTPESATVSSAKEAAARIPRATSPGEMRGEMLFRNLGTTGVQVSVIGLGGSHLGQAQVAEDLAIKLIHEALDRGINFLDNSWDYNEGRSEERVGKALSQSGYRQKAFVMTKI